MFSKLYLNLAETFGIVKSNFEFLDTLKQSQGNIQNPTRMRLTALLKIYKVSIHFVF